MTALIKISCPTCERSLSFQSCNRFQFLSIILLNSFVRDLPTKTGKPKYVSYLWELKILATSSYLLLRLLGGIAAEINGCFGCVQLLTKGSLIFI
jgi:hypothetical protein